MRSYTFRFDDISLNTDTDKLRKMTDFIGNNVNATIVLAVSPAIYWLGHVEGKEKERVFPRILNAHSDYREFYRVQKVGVPDFVYQFAELNNVTLAGHGLIHVDHRLLSRKVQELSILTSCSLIGSRVFVPPFNKWNKKTEEICAEHGLTLIKFDETIWRHLVYTPFTHDFKNYYLHTHDFTFKEFVSRFPQSFSA